MPLNMITPPGIALVVFRDRVSEAVTELGDFSTLSVEGLLKVFPSEVCRHCSRLQGTEFGDNQGIFFGWGEANDHCQAEVQSPLPGVSEGRVRTALRRGFFTGPVWVPPQGPSGSRAPLSAIILLCQQCPGRGAAAGPERRWETKALRGRPGMQQAG